MIPLRHGAGDGLVWTSLLSLLILRLTALRTGLAELIEINFLGAVHPPNLLFFSNFGMLREFNEDAGLAERGPSLVVLLVRSVGADKVSSGF